MKLRRSSTTTSSLTVPPSWSARNPSHESGRQADTGPVPHVLWAVFEPFSLFQRLRRWQRVRSGTEMIDVGLDGALDLTVTRWSGETAPPPPPRELFAAVLGTFSCQSVREAAAVPTGSRPSRGPVRATGRSSSAAVGDLALRSSRMYPARSRVGRGTSSSVNLDVVRVPFGVTVVHCGAVCSAERREALRARRLRQDPRRVPVLGTQPTCRA